LEQKGYIEKVSFGSLWKKFKEKKDADMAGSHCRRLETIKSCGGCVCEFQSRVLK
jgi:hypothetical protein